MVLPNTWLFETIKLVAQLAGALLVAALTVRWALSRFKREKAWERKSQLYSDILQSLSDLDRTVSNWIKAEEEQFSWSEEHKESMYERHRLAYIRLDQSKALGLLLLPAETNATLSWFYAAIDQIDEDQHTLEIHYEQAEKIRIAMEEIVTQGKAELGVQR